MPSDALDALRARWPGREGEIARLWGLLEEPRLAVPLYVYGPSGGGKSGVVCGVLDALGARHAILDCVTCCTPRSVFESALTQLNRHVPRASNGYTGWSPCDSAGAFVAGLQEAIAEFGRVVLVLENAMELERRQGLRTLLLSLETLCASGAVWIVFVAEAPWQEMHTASAFSSLVCVRFGGYSKGQLTTILALDAPSTADAHAAAYRDFLPLFIAYCWEICRDLHELRYLCRAAFHQWMQPVRDGLLQPSEKLALVSHGKACLQETRKRVYVREATLSRTGELARAGALASNPGLVLPNGSKWLLVAGYLASRCLPQKDASLFGAKQKTHVSKRAKKAQLSTDEQHAFPMQRLLAIYASIRVGADQLPSTELLSQLATLLHMRLLGRVSRPEELDKVRLSCTASPELVGVAAKEINFDLAVYFDE